MIVEHMDLNSQTLTDNISTDKIIDIAIENFKLEIKKRDDKIINLLEIIKTQNDLIEQLRQQTFEEQLRKIGKSLPPEKRHQYEMLYIKNKNKYIQIP